MVQLYLSHPQDIRLEYNTFLLFSQIPNKQQITNHLCQILMWHTGDFGVLVCWRPSSSTHYTNRQYTNFICISLPNGNGKPKFLKIDVNAIEPSVKQSHHATKSLYSKSCSFLYSERHLYSVDSGAATV